jgi:hypothetical protein
MLVRTRLLLAPAVAAVLLSLAAPAQAAPSGQVFSDDITLTASADGVLHAKETVTFQGSGVRRAFVRLKHVDDRRDRRFEVGDVRGGSVTRDGDRTVVTPSGGPGRHTVKLTYAVRGTMTPQRGRQELSWVAAGGWNVPAAQTQVTVESGAAVQSLNCFAGALDGTVGCTQFFTNHTHVQAEFRQEDLEPGEYLTIVIGYPPGTTSGQPMFDQRHTLATAFTVNTATGATLVGLLVLLLGGVALLYSTRGRDARIVSKKAAEGDHAPVDDGRFCPPDGVRPGQIGTLIDEQADVVDVTATIIDLAVRRYLLIEELSRETYGRLDWQLRRLDRPADDLMPYERVLYDALFAGRDVVRLSELGGTFAGQLAAVRGALYEDVVRQGWFTRRPDSERTRWTPQGPCWRGSASSARSRWRCTRTWRSSAWRWSSRVPPWRWAASTCRPRRPTGRPCSRTRWAFARTSTVARRRTRHRWTGWRCSRAIYRTPWCSTPCRAGRERWPTSAGTGSAPTTFTGTRGRRSGTCPTSPSRCAASRWPPPGPSRRHVSSAL